MKPALNSRLYLNAAVIQAKGFASFQAGVIIYIQADGSAGEKVDSRSEKETGMRVGRIAFLMIFLVAGPVMAGPIGPKISFDKETLNYGRVAYGDTVTEEFTVRNTGDQPLTIDNVQAGCGCTKAIKESSEVEPGGKTKIIASFDTNGFVSSGLKQKSVFVNSNDPQRPEVKLTLLADVVRDLNVNPLNLSSKIEEFQEKVSFPVKVTNNSDKVVELIDLKSKDGTPPAKMPPEKAVLQPHSTVPVTIEVTLKNQPGREFFIGHLNMETNHPREKEIELRYMVKLQNPS
jgi:hypothetical protein